MLIGNLDINLNEVSDITYDRETDLITIEWNRAYSDKTVSALSAKFGRKAYNFKPFVRTLIKKVSEDLNKEIEKYEDILEKLE